MYIATDENGNMCLYDSKTNEKIEGIIENIEFDAGEVSESQPLLVKLEFYPTKINIVGCNKGYEKNITVYTVCSECGKKECSCNELRHPVSSACLSIRNEDNTALGYVNRVAAKQNYSKDKQPIIKLQRYKIVDDKAVLNAAGTKVVFDIDEF